MWRAILSLSLASLLVRAAHAQLPPPDDPKNVIHDLAHGLHAVTPGSRITSAKALAAYAGELRFCVTVLRGCLRNDPEPEVRVEAAQALANIGPSAYEAVPELIEALGDKEKALRRMAALALGQIGRYAGDAVPALTRALKDPSKAVRRRAVMALGAIGHDARPAVPALIGLLDDTDLSQATNEPPVRESAIITLGRLGPDARAAVPALLKLEHSAAAPIRALCLAALCRIGADRRTVVPLLLKALQDPDSRADAAATLAKLTPPAREAVPALVEALRAKPVAHAAEARRIKLSIMYALARIGPDAKAALPALRKLTMDSDDVVSAYARQWIKQIDSSK
jgi:HEAT repeat protein